jgi:hypothetical protein
MTRSKQIRHLPAPWDGFLREIDSELDREIEIHCIGGFVLKVLFDLPRPTADIDYIAAAPAAGSARLLAVAGQGSRLAKKYGLYMQFVAVSDLPDDYAERLVDIAPGSLSKLRLRALAAEDLLLAKLTRNSPKDIHDVLFLAERSRVDPQVFRDRYREHLRPYLANAERHDLTLDLWVDEIVAARERGGDPEGPNQR